MSYETEGLAARSMAALRKTDPDGYQKAMAIRIAAAENAGPIAGMRLADLGAIKAILADEFDAMIRAVDEVADIAVLRKRGAPTVALVAMKPLVSELSGHVTEDGVRRMARTIIEGNPEIGVGIVGRQGVRHPGSWRLVSYEFDDAGIDVATVQSQTTDPKTGAVMSTPVQVPTGQTLTVHVEIMEVSGAPVPTYHPVTTEIMDVGAAPQDSGSLVAGLAVAIDNLASAAAAGFRPTGEVSAEVAKLRAQLAAAEEQLRERPTRNRPGGKPKPKDDAAPTE